MPPCTCTPMEATSQPMSVENALAMGVSSATRLAAAARSRRVLGAAGHVRLPGRDEADGASGLRQRLHGHERAADVGVLDDGAHLAALARCRAALPAILGIGDGLLRRALGHRHALRADRQPRRVHHDEHDVEAAVLLAQQVADGAVLLAVLHHAGGARMDAELVLDARADHVVARAQRAVLVDEILRHHEQRDAARAGRRIGQARQHQMHDIVGHLVIAVGDENLGAEDAVGAVGLLLGLGS